MKIYFTKSFSRDYKKLSKELQKILDRKIGVLVENWMHPGLRIKKMQGYQNVWEGRITRGYRFTFEWQEENLILRRTGKHDILDKPI